MKIVTSFSDPTILEKYDGFLVDQWGVMHDGAAYVEGAPACIEKLARQHGKKMVILSNSPSSEEDTLKKLGPLGFEREYFEGGAITSGDLASEYVREKYGKHRSKVLFMAWDHPAAPSHETFLENCGDIHLVSSVEEKPNVIVVLGNMVLLGDAAGDSKVSMGDFVQTGNTEGVMDNLLINCQKLGIPLVCVDPDLITFNPDGSTFYMPGTVAKRYEELGGESVYFGKPYSDGFKRGVDRLKDLGVTDVSKIAMIGDSIHHDLIGSQSIENLDCILVLGGVHRKELGHSLGSMPDQKALDELFIKHNATPSLVVPALKYSE